MSSCWERNQGLIVIPPGLSRWKNIGADEATIVSMPSDSKTRRPDAGIAVDSDAPEESYRINAQ